MAQRRQVANSDQHKKNTQTRPNATMCRDILGVPAHPDVAFIKNLFTSKNTNTHKTKAQSHPAALNFWVSNTSTISCIRTDRQVCPPQVDHRKNSSRNYQTS